MAAADQTQTAAAVAEASTTTQTAETADYMTVRGGIEGWLKALPTKPKTKDGAVVAGEYYRPVAHAHIKAPATGACDKVKTINGYRLRGLYLIATSATGTTPELVQLEISHMPEGADGFPDTRGMCLRTEDEAVRMCDRLAVPKELAALIRERARMCEQLNANAAIKPKTKSAAPSVMF